MSPNCTCGSLAPIIELIDNFKPRVDGLLAENVMSAKEWQERHANAPHETAEQITAALAATVAEAAATAAAQVLDVARQAATDTEVKG
jgi:hypothetical protein